MSVTLYILDIYSVTDNKKKNIMPEWLSSILGGSAGIFNNVLNRVLGLSRAEREQNEFNAFEAQKSRDFQESLFQRGNDFNAQQAQLNRDFQASQYQTAVKDMRAAGINPAMAVGGVSGLSGASATAASAPSAAQASGNGRGVQSNLSEVLQAAMFSRTIKQMDAEIAKTDSEAFVNQMNAKLAGANAGLAESALRVADVKNDLELRQMSSALHNDEVRRALDKAHISQSEAETLLTRNNAMIAAADAKTRADLNAAELRLRLAEERLKYNQSAEVLQHITKMKAECAELYQRCILEAAEAGKMDAETQNYYVQNDILQYDREKKHFEVVHQNADRVWNKVSMVTGMIRDVGSGVGNLVSPFKFGTIGNPAPAVQSSVARSKSHEFDPLVQAMRLGTSY